MSVTRRLTSSGIVTSKLRSPASTCATGMSSLAQTSAAARVELTSPYATTMAGRLATNSSSSAASRAPVWWPWLPDPTPRLTSGDGSDRSRKKTSDSSGS